MWCRGLVDRLHKQLTDVAAEEYADYDHVPFENNFAERQTRPAVILRKNGQSNRSDQEAATQGVLMSVYRTLRLRALESLQGLPPGCSS